MEEGLQRAMRVSRSWGCVSWRYRQSEHSTRSALPTLDAAALSPHARGSTVVRARRSPVRLRPTLDWSWGSTCSRSVMHTCAPRIAADTPSAPVPLPTSTTLCSGEMNLEKGLEGSARRLHSTSALWNRQPASPSVLTSGKLSAASEMEGGGCTCMKCLAEAARLPSLTSSKQAWKLCVHAPTCRLNITSSSAPLTFLRCSCPARDVLYVFSSSSSASMNSSSSGLSTVPALDLASSLEYP
mmetsp:Transcript_39744/g.94209  ORF Transcript_39744/g.94209 Transcript_39744/m.94209 type:complete len:241 (-) Transcript_39744:69-791(-)